LVEQRAENVQSIALVADDWKRRQKTAKGVAQTPQEENYTR
jgi:hypothetical protein